MYNPFDILGNILFFPIIVAILILKGVALWKAAKQDQKEWFIALLILQTFGILELVYLLIYQKDANPKYKNWFKTKSKLDQVQGVKDIEPKKTETK